MNRFAAIALFVATTASAQTFTENFNHYSAQSEPTAWLDSSAGRFKTFDDPLAPGNIVYGAKHPSIRQRSANRRPPGDVPDLGAYATLSGQTFALGTGFEFRGRFLRATDTSLVGVAFFSSRPESRDDRLLALWRNATDTAPTMRFYRTDAGVLHENARSTFTPAPSTWYRFAIRADAEGAGTRIRVRIWNDGSEEPREWMLDSVETDLSRTSGRIGLWSAVGAAYFDDLSVVAETDEEEVDESAPAIVFSESAETIPHGTSEAFNRDVRIDVRALDGSGVRSLIVTLDAAPYVPGAPITIEGKHVLRARAIDTKGNIADAEVSVIVDKSIPVITIAPLPTLTNQIVTPVINVTDLTELTVTITLDDAPFTSGTPVAAERLHTLVVNAEDALGWKNSATVAFTIDRTPPVISIAPIAPLTNQNVTPQITVNEPSTIAATLNGAAFTPGTLIVEERAHTLVVTATDGAGNASNASATFTIDRTPPVISIAPIAPLTNQNVTPEFTLNEPATITATLNGVAFTAGSTITEERAHTLVATATDGAGNTSNASATFTIDRTPPVVTFTSPALNARVGTRQVTVTGTAGDAVSVTINGISAVLQNGEFTAVVELLEGANDLVALAHDLAGNAGSGSLRVHLDTRAPDLEVLAPAANACIASAEVALRGTVVGAVSVTVRVGEAAPVAATITGDEWSATLPIAEGSVAVIVEATDEGGRVTSRVLPLRIDRTKPLIVVTEGGVPFTATLLSRTVAPNVQVTDADTNTMLTITLDGTAYESGTIIDGERTHLLRATATDCAGNVSDPFELAFTIDRTPPSIVSMTPAAGASVGDTPTLRGTLSEPASVALEGTSIEAVVTGVTFTLDAPLEDGLNELALLATDPAGNDSRMTYSLRVDTSRPQVEIVENGLPIEANALFNRAVKPVIRVNDSSATLTATLSGQPFTAGASITADASYTLIAKATDTFGRASDEVTATFTIDRTPPRIEITSPADGSSAANENIEVRGTVDADAERVLVNGTSAAIAGTTFTATLRVEEGPTVLTATAVDRAGNSARDHIAVTRNSGRLAILLTAPPDGMLTNRPSTVVSGQVLNAPPSGTVRINGIDIAVDAAGAFRHIDFPLHEGTNEITATVASSTGELNEVSVDVIADYTAPSLVVTANGIPLVDGDRFAIAPRIALEATGPTTLTIDGAIVTGEITLADGGHALTAIARDAAGNETRIDRTFFIGETVLVAGCGFTQLDPVDGAVVFTELVRITGRSGGAASVLINGNAAQVADGSFCGDATLVPGRNEVTIRCADAGGNPTSDAPVTLVLWRDVEPSIAISSPAPASMAMTPKVTVEGTVSAGVISGDVNGLAFTLPQGATSFSVPNVALAPGLNVITARAKTGSGRTAIATTRVTYLAGTPQIVITSPITGTETGASSIDVSGTYLNVDPSTIRVSGAPASTTRVSETSGTFTATVALAPGALNTIVATAAGTTASVQVQQIIGAPSIAITAPIDNVYLSSTFAGPLAVTGTLTTPEGSRVLVNGVVATISGDTFNVAIPLTTTAAPLPILARVTTPDGVSATDTVRAIRFAAPLALRDSFPAANATGVDRGAAIILLFNNALNGDTASAAIRVSDTAGTNIDGQLFVDRDAITFAPHAPLRANETYTVTISTALRDASDAPLAATHTLHFTTAAIAPATVPIVDDLVTSGCLSAITLTGRAAIPGARVRLDADGVTLTTISSDTGAFKFTFSFSGQTGFHIARVREIGMDGSLSAERAICFRINCELPRVLAATLDRAGRKLVIDFSRPMNASTLIASATGTIRIVPDGGTALTGTVTLDANTATIVIDSEIPEVPITLTVTKDAKDTNGASLLADYTQRFLPETSGTQQGRGYVTGAVYDATSGRPLANATIAVADATIITNDRGRYSRALPEGAWTIAASAEGYTSAWRQVVVPAGAGVVPIDIRLTKRNAPGLVELVWSAAAAAAALPQLTSVGAQSIAGLLPLGWSPLAAAELIVDNSLATPTPGASLTFVIDATAVRAATQTLSLVRYDHERDEWRVLTAVANVPDNGRVTIPIDTAGHYALVYPDAAPHLAHPPAARTGEPLASASLILPPSSLPLTSRSFTIEPRAILPGGRALATLITEGATQTYPSGTAVQATIDEQLNLADGRVIVDPPFATDLLLYRTLAGDSAVADFHLSPTPIASTVLLRDGIERIRIVDYPGRIDRGTLLGAEGGRIPGDGGATIDVPPGATIEPLHASTMSMSDTDLAAFGTIAGFRIAGGFTLTLTGATNAPATLLIPARGTFTIANDLLGPTPQVVIAEVRSRTTFGLTFEMIAIADAASSIANSRLFTTRAIDSTQLPLDGIIRDGRYLILVAQSPIAFAFGQVRAGPDGVAIADARVTAGINKPQTALLGITSITRIGGLFTLPVAATPAAPFSLIARAEPTGDGATALASTAPATSAFVNFGVLPLVAQPPQLRGVSPDSGEVAVNAAFLVRAEFDVAIDPASVAGGIRVLNLTTGTAMSGNVTAAGNIVTFNPGEPLRAASQYTITIAPTIRNLGGTPFAQTIVKSFTTSARPQGSTAFHPDRIRITMPDANGRSIIRGTAGALPAGSQAVAVRRGRFFIVAYQATVATDGSFSFDAGHGDARDAITIDDIIDLQVVDAVSHAVVSVIELTPFVRDDARAFIARHDRDTRFVSADGIVVHVPRGAFDAPTIIEVAPAQESAFAQVPMMDTELRYAASVELKFEGIAKQRLDIELPIPAGLDTANRNWLFGYLGQSMRGPRVMIVDLAHVSGSSFHTGLAGSARNAFAPSTNAALTGAELRKHLLGINRSGIFAAVDIRVPAGSGLGWAVMEGLQAGFDLFWDTLASLFASAFYLLENRGTIVVPIVTGKPFTLVGVDVGTGLEAYSKVYDPIPIGDPGASVVLADPNPDRVGPYPIFASPFRVEMIDIAIEDVEIPIRDFTARLKNGRINVLTTLPNDVNVTLFNVMNGDIDRQRGGGLEVAGAKGDRIVLLVAERDVDPYASLSIVFDEAIDDTALETVIAIETAPASGGAFLPITGAIRMSTDPSGRRVSIAPPASLTRGNRYRIALSPNLTNKKGMRIGQTRDADGNIQGGLDEPLYLEVQVRVPGDLRTTFDLQSGVIRDQALMGNVLLVAAGEGGLAAYDVADPAGMQPGTAPMARVAGAADYWSLATDHHGRIYATGITALFGVMHSFRLEGFLANQPAIVGGAAVSYVPGSSSGAILTSGLLTGDRVEAYPRKLQVLVQDTITDYTGEALEQLANVELISTDGDFQILDANFARDVARPYATQRFTVENITLDLRWSADATVSQPAHIAGIVARKTDQLRVIQNESTYGVLSLFGFGIGVYDLNAVESNDAPEKPAGYETLREQIRITRARAECGPFEPEAIPDLTFSPDATIVTRTGSTALHILALDLHRGVLDLAIEPGTDAGPSCSERAPIGLLLRDHPRIAKLRERFIEHENREPFGRFTGAARYRWTLEQKDNVGQRGSAINTRVQRDYMLIPGNEYGLLVVEIAGNPPPTLVPSYQPLQPIHLVDVIWIPGGAYAVRTIAGSNLATVIDGQGHALLVDLSQLDERWNGNELIDVDALFATASKVLEDNVHTPDPRIVWRSATPLATGTVAPVVDPDTGFLYVGKTLQKTTSVVAALDPKLTFRSVKGNVAMTGIVPHGIAPPAGFTSDSLGSFRVETTLPGGIGQSIESGALILAVDSERVFGAKTEDTPDGWPHAHLTDLALRRVLPITIPGLRHQSGYNRWISYPVVAIADPRASKFYSWPPGANKAAEGCYACDPPAVANAQEIFSFGRAFRVRAGNAFLGSGYAYLSENGRFEARIATIPADTIRPPAMRVAAQQPVTAGGMLQDTTHLHSGEVETAAIDFDFGGRAGWNVTLDRSYRSRTIGLAPLGPGWDSAIFKRLRVLPDGVVEYRDGAEIWPFRLQGGQYVAPLGLFLRLTKTATGWSLTDQKWRITTFDQYGRLASESDEFYSPDKPDSGNTIHYLYDANGRLGTIVDPVGRLTTLSWNAQTGSLVEVSDWRSPKRTITFTHDPAQRRLMKVELPSVANISGQRPFIDFGYQETSAQFNDRLEIATNLTTVRNPTETVSNGSPRVTFTYELDRVTRQQWATGERATFSYPSPTTAVVTDVLGQERHYTFNANDADLLGDRAHATTVREIDVPVWGGAVVPGIPQATNTDRIQTFHFSAGVLDSAKLEGVRDTTISHVLPAGAPGLLVKSVTTTPLATGDDAPIQRVLEYQAGPNGSTFLQAIEAGGKRIASPEPHRNNIEPTAIHQSDSLTEQQKFDAQGRVKKITSTGGTDTAGAGSEGNIDYWPDSAALHKRGLPKVIRSGALETKVEYPSETQTVATDPRGVITTTTFDEWGRTKKINVVKPGDPLSLTEQYTYDASGRLHDVVRTRNGGDVTTRYRYDAMGRTTRQETDQIATIFSLSTTTEYHLDTRTIITRQSSGASTTTKLDPLGRIIHSRTETGSSPIEERFGYDLAGNRVFATDMLTATAETFDVHGRVVKSRFADGTSQSAEYDEWDRPKITNRLADNGTAVGESSYTFTDTGRLRSLVSKVDTGVSRTTDFAWDGGGRTTRVATNGRASETKFDLAGRLLKHAAGAGSLTSLTDAFSTTNVTSHDGVLPSKTTTAEKFSGSYTATAKHNTAGDVTEEAVGSLSWKQTFDQLGSVTSASVPGRKAATWSVDARGAIKEEKLPDGATNRFEYGASGAQSQYRDPENEPTQTSSDLIGRPMRRNYADGTVEVITWQGARLQSVTDRQGRKQSYVYNSKGQLSEIRDDATVLTDKLTYDNAGRLISWRTADSEVAWSDFNLQDAPKKTTQRRFRDGSGLSALVVLDEFVQTHTWNEHGERTSYTMPFHQGQTIGAGWTASVRHTYDAMGNITEISRGPVLMSAKYRNGGRPETRTVTTAGGATILRTYGYDTATAQLKKLVVDTNGVAIAGSDVQYDGLQLKAAQLLGVSSGQRFMQWRYDDRSRLLATLAGVGPADDPLAPAPGRVKEDLTPADYRLAQERVSKFDAPTAAVLNTKGIDTSEIDPPSSHFERRPGGGHKIGKFTQGPDVRAFGWNGAERVDDGRFTYEFDARGRLIRATEKTNGPPTRRILYYYSGPGRVVGRIAQYALSADDWRLEDRAPVLEADGLPAQATYVWDPISDNLLAVFESGGDLLKQVIHGGAAYDDPLETTTIDKRTGAITHLYPVYDEAGAGSLQVLLNEEGEVVARVLPNDAYGADDVDFAGAAIDNASIQVTKDAAGAIEQVEIRLHATESLAPATIASGSRLATVDASGAVVRTSTVPATLTPDDPFTLHWTLTPTQWTDLIAPVDPAHPPVALSVAVTNTLRAIAWAGDLPVLPAPAWATATQPVTTTPDHPVEIRHPLSVLSAFASATSLGETKTSTIYTIDSLALAGTSGGSGSFIEDAVSARFHGLPFTEPATGLVYVRNRWYDPETGTFLSPDPLGYQDSSNLYAFAGGDPVNGRDPLGLRSDAKDLPRNFKVPKVRERRNDAAAARSEASIQCGTAALTDRAQGAAIGAVPGVAETSTGARMAQHAGRIIDAARAEGAGAAIGAAWDAYTEELQTLPFIRWGRQAVAASNADVSGDACAEAYHRTGLAVDVASDVALAIGAAQTLRTPSAGTSGPRASTKPQWLRDVEAGTNFNKARTFDYPYREVYVENPKGGYYRLDAYDPLRGEIVSRKLTQFNSISESTAISYVNELAAKYPAGTPIANVPSSGPLAGQYLRGQLILEVPVQTAPVPPAVSNAARARGVVIRDVFGNVY